MSLYVIFSLHSPTLCSRIYSVRKHVGKRMHFPI